MVLSFSKFNLTYAPLQSTIECSDNETLKQRAAKMTLNELLARTKNVLTGQVVTAERSEYFNHRFEEGVEYGNKCEYISVAVNNVWGGRGKECYGGGSISSYEKIGYHAGSVDFILGVLSTDCPIYVYGEDCDGKLVKSELTL